MFATEAAPHPGRPSSPGSTSVLRRAIRAYRIEVSVSAEVKFTVHDGRGGVEPIVERVFGENFERGAVLEHHGRAIAASDVDPSRCADWRRKNVRRLLETLHLIVRLCPLRRQTPTTGRCWSSECRARRRTATVKARRAYHDRTSTTTFGVPVMSPLAPARRIAFRLLPRKPLVANTIPSAATGDGIGFIVRPAVSQITSPRRQVVASKPVHARHDNVPASLVLDDQGRGPRVDLVALDTPQFVACAFVESDDERGTGNEVIPHDDHGVTVQRRR